MRSLRTRKPVDYTEPENLSIQKIRKINRESSSKTKSAKQAQNKENLPLNKQSPTQEDILESDAALDHSAKVKKNGFSCARCNQLFKQKAGLTKHYKKCKPETLKEVEDGLKSDSFPVQTIKDKENTLSCQQCNRVFKQKAGLTRHSKKCKFEEKAKYKVLEGETSNESSRKDQNKKKTDLMLEFEENSDTSPKPNSRKGRRLTKKTENEKKNIQQKDSCQSSPAQKKTQKRQRVQKKDKTSKLKESPPTSKCVVIGVSDSFLSMVCTPVAKPKKRSRLGYREKRQRKKPCQTKSPKDEIQIKKDTFPPIPEESSLIIEAGIEEAPLKEDGPQENEEKMNSCIEEDRGIAFQDSTDEATEGTCQDESAQSNDGSVKTASKIDTDVLEIPLPRDESQEDDNCKRDLVRGKDEGWDHAKEVLPKQDATITVKEFQDSEGDLAVLQQACDLEAPSMEIDRTLSNRAAEEMQTLEKMVAMAEDSEPKFSYKDLLTLEETQDEGLLSTCTTQEILEQLSQTAKTVDKLVTSLSDKEFSCEVQSSIQSLESSKGEESSTDMSEAAFWKQRYEQLAEMRITEPERAYNDLLKTSAEQEKINQEIQIFYQSQYQRINLLDSLKTPVKTPKQSKLSLPKYSGAKTSTSAPDSLAACEGRSLSKQGASETSSILELQRKCEKQRRLILLYQALTSLCIKFPDLPGSSSEDSALDFGTAVCTAINHLQERVVQFKLLFDDTKDEEVYFKPTANLHLLPSFLQDDLKFSASNLPLFFIRLAQALYSKSAQTDPSAHRFASEK